MSRQMTISLEHIDVEAASAQLRTMLSAGAEKLPSTILGLSLTVLDVGAAADQAARYLEVSGSAEPDPVWREFDASVFRVAVVLTFRAGCGDDEFARATADKLARELTQRLSCRAVLTEDEISVAVYERGARRVRPPE